MWVNKTQKFLNEKIYTSEVVSDNGCEFFSPINPSKIEWKSSFNYFIVVIQVRLCTLKSFHRFTRSLSLVYSALCFIHQKVEILQNML